MLVWLKWLFCAWTRPAGILHAEEIDVISGWYFFLKRNREDWHLKLFSYFLKYKERQTNGQFRHSYQKPTLSPSISLEGRSWNWAAYSDTGNHLSLLSRSFCLYLASYEMLKYFSSLLLSRDFPSITLLSQRFCLHWKTCVPPWGESRGARLPL